MFTNLANYLLGTITNQQQPQEQGAASMGVQQQQQQPHETNLRLTSGDDEEDWVLVDRDSEGNSERSSISDISEFGIGGDGVDDDDVVDDDERRELFIPRVRTRSSSASSLPSCTAMEESWFITPPPCFTSAGPVQLETSPLENLLIEHPSMSVYHHHPQHHHHHHVMVMRRNNSAPVQVVAELSAAPVTSSTPAVSSNNNNSNNANDKKERKEGRKSRRRQQQQQQQQEVVVNEELRVDVVRRGATAPAPRRVCSRGEIVERQERQCRIAKTAQKAQIQKACEYLKKGYMERNNKARDVNNRNRRLRRGERSQGATRSYANNNRKC